MYSCILWDVDGTIADASAGILPRLIEVFGSYGMTPPPAEELSHWIGPPMYESFQRYGMDADRAADAVERYRRLAARDGYAASVRIYPGVTEVLHAVAAAGIPQATASSKPENQVVAILDHYGLSGLFTAIVGAQPGAEDKASAIGRALEELAAQGADVTRPVLIGDRVHDIEGAAEHGIPVIFAEWGFGEPAEGAPAEYRAGSAEALLPLLVTDRASDPVS